MFMVVRAVVKGKLYRYTIELNEAKTIFLQHLHLGLPFNNIFNYAAHVVKVWFTGCKNQQKLFTHKAVSRF
jgi:hypothetical protein